MTIGELSGSFKAAHDSPYKRYSAMAVAITDTEVIVSSLKGIFMAYFSVSYDLRKKDFSQYEVLIQKLEKMNSVKFQDSEWFVDQGKTAKQILESLKPYIHEDDRLMVTEFVKKPQFTKSLQGTNDWIAARTFQP